MTRSVLAWLVLVIALAGAACRGPADADGGAGAPAAPVVSAEPAPSAAPPQDYGY